MLIRVSRSAIPDIPPPGSPVRIGPNNIVTDEPALQRLMAAPRSPFLKGHWFKGMKFDPRVDNLLSMSDEKAHTELRAKLMPGVCAKHHLSLLRPHC